MKKALALLIILFELSTASFAQMDTMKKVPQISAEQYL